MITPNFFKTKRKKRILLTEKDFKKLTSGKIVEKDNVEIALQDIGYFHMLQIIKYNMTND